MSTDEIPETTEVGTTPAWSATPWTIKLYGSRNAAVAMAKSKVWPGAFSACKGGKFANIYIGDGCIGGYGFTPEPPPKILSEADDVVEQDDVTLDAENELLKAIEEAKMAAEGEDEYGGEE